jgi:Mrp family chromosome partitioning ATPase/capsular polysaccharide biosynthesis protein
MNETDIERAETAELADYIRVIRERAWVIAVAVVVVVAAAAGVSLAQTPQYRATASLLYQKSNLDQALFGSQVFVNPNQDREVRTGADLAKMEPIVGAVAQQVGSDISVEQLRRMITVKPQTNSNVVGIEAVSTSPDQAAQVANAFVEQFVVFRQQNDRAAVAGARELVKQQLDSLSLADSASEYGLMLKEKYESLRILESMQTGGFTIVERAAVPATAFAPQPVRNSILGLVVGLVLGVGIAFLLDYLDRRIKDEKSLEHELGAPVLASIPAVGGRWLGGGRGKARFDAAIGFHKHPSLIEPFRTLRSSLQYFDVDTDKHVYLVTSGLPREGKTTTTINLALSLAVSGKRVIVVEADLRRPMVNEYLGLESSLGLSSILARTEGTSDFLQLVRADDFMPVRNGDSGEARARKSLQRNVYILPSGPVPPNPAELLSSRRMGKLVEELAGMADYVLIDTPPLLLVSDALVLGQHVNGVILTIRLNSTTRDEVREMRSTFERAGIRVVGAVAGGAKRSPAYYRKRGYGYGYGDYELEY